MDRLYSTSDAGKLLGGLHAKDVCALIRQGKLRGHIQTVRGTGERPRRYVFESEIKRYMADLPSAPTADDVTLAERPKRQARRGVIAGVKQYV